MDLVPVWDTEPLVEGQPQTPTPVDNISGNPIPGQPVREQLDTFNKIINCLNSFEQRRTLGPNLEQANQHQQADWNLAFQSNLPLIPANLVKWIIIVSKEFAEAIDNSIRNMMKASGPNNDQILAFQIVKLNDDDVITNYLDNIDSAQQDGKEFQMVFVILSDNRVDLYSAVVERLRSLDFPSACLFANDAISIGLLPTATAKAVEMCLKFNLEYSPWNNKVPLDNIMVVGFDVYQPKGSAIFTGGMVSTAGDSYFSITSTHLAEEELANYFNINLKKCCNTYKLKKGFLPDRIIIFRSGVDRDLLGYIKMLEVPQILDTLRKFYRGDWKEIPKLSYIVVVKKITRRMMSDVEFSGSDNPPPSTIVDGEVTLPRRYHFYLVSQGDQVVYRPTSYFVLYDTLGLTPEQMQAMTYKMCYVCFDWSGVVLVPLICLFAYKLAFAIGISRGKTAQHDTEHNVTFL